MKGMNNLNLRLFYEVHKTKIKITTSIILGILLLVLIVCFIIFNSDSNIPFYKEKSQTYSVIESSDKSFILSLNNDYNLQNSNSNNYVLILKSSDNFSLTVSKVSKYNFELLEILKSDQQSFLESLGNYTNLSEILEIKYNNISGYLYSLNYTQNSKEYILTEFLTEINGNLYFFDIKYPKNQEKKYKDIQNDLLNSISIN